MEKILRFALVLAALVISLNGLRAQSPAPAAPAAAPAATEPMLTISLPANLKAEDVVNAVNKAFEVRKWSDIVVTNNKVTASHSQGGVSLHANAVCSASEVKLFADYKMDGKVTPERAKAAALRWLRSLEKSTKQELGLLPKKGEKKKAD